MKSLQLSTFLKLRSTLLDDMTVGFARFAGPRKDILALIDELPLINKAEAINSLSTDAFVYFYVFDVYYAHEFYQAAKELMKKYPNCEYFRHTGRDEFADYEFSSPGETTTFLGTYYEKPLDYGSEFYELLGSNWDDKTEIAILLKDGTTISYERKGKAAYKQAGKYKKQAFSIDSLVSLCCPSTTENKKASFKEAFIKQIPSVDLIDKITVSLRTTMNPIYTPEMSGNLSVPIADSSITAYIAFHHRIVEQHCFDLTNSVVTEEKWADYYAPLDPLGGKPAYAYTEFYRWPSKQTALKFENSAGSSSTKSAEKSLAPSGKTREELKQVFRFKKVAGGLCLTKYKGTDADVEIPSVVDGLAVVEIETNAFYNCRQLKSVIVPKGVRSTGESVFSGCSSLVNVSFPEGLVSIGPYTFGGCKSLQKVIFNDPETLVGRSAFDGCLNPTVYAPAKSKALKYAKTKGLPFAVIE